MAAVYFFLLKRKFAFRDTHELKSDQSDWVKTTTEQIHTLLKETPPHGDKFCETVKNILKREEYWNAWKNEGCPPFKRPHADAKESEETKKPKRQRRRLGDIMKDANGSGKYFLGK